MQVIRKILGIKPKIGDNIISNDGYGIITEGVVLSESDYFYRVNGTVTFFDSYGNKKVDNGEAIVSKNTARHK